MPHQCASGTKNGTRCSRILPDNVEFCWQHIGQVRQEIQVAAQAAARAAPRAAARAAAQAAQCEGVTRQKIRCTHTARDGHFCKIHQVFPRPGVNTLDIEFARDARSTAMINYFASIDAIDHGYITEAEFARIYILFFNADIEFRQLTFTMNEQIAHMRILNQHEHAPQGPYNLALDTQNIHRREVTSQTNTFLDILFANNQTTFNEDKWQHVTSWIGATVGGVLRRDMKKWYNQPYCKEEGDWLYRRTLNAVVNYARTHKEYEEIRKRIHEECTESIGMCCEGHIARLCNALVGFHEDAVSAVVLSAGEILQDRFAALAARGGTVEEGRTILTELAIPADQWDNWLSAL